MEWEFDDASFADAAQVVMCLNDELVRKHGKKSEVIKWLKSETQWNCPRPGYWGVAGFNVSVTWKSGETGKVLYARADPAGWLVLGAMIAASSKGQKKKEKEA
jgi:hypothetical protein